jgi:hypothetical protein
VVSALASQAPALAPLGLPPPKRSPLAEANARRPAALYQARFATRYGRCQAMAPAHGFRCKSRLLSLDSTTSSRGWSLLPWARFRTTQGAITLHTRLDHAGSIPAFVVITQGQQREVALARGRRRAQGSLVAMDRGSIDDRCVFRRHQDGVSCVTRQQGNARVKGTARVVVDRSTGVTSDHHVMLVAQQSAASPTVWRRGGDRDSATGRHDVGWTHAFHVAAATMAALDKQRWQRERFFKAIQQNLTIKTFFGTSENAVMPPIGVALSPDLLRAFRRFKAGLGLSFQQMLRLLQLNLFDRRKLIDRCTPQPPDGAARPLRRVV